MAEVTIKLSLFASADFCLLDADFNQISIKAFGGKSKSTGIDKALVKEFDLSDQNLLFQQETGDSPVMLKELVISVKNINLSFMDLEFKSHKDPKMKKGLLAALAKKRN